jgi:heme-degrading monooxygenase HmoA
MRERNRMVFVQLATAEPQPGKEGELIERMKGFADFLRKMPGLVDVFVLREDETGSLVGLSIWSDKASFEKAMAEPSNLPSKTAVTLKPPRVRRFSELEYA